MNEALGNWLKMQRARLNLTQADLAWRAGVTHKSINSVENGFFVPSTVLALKLAQVLAAPVESLFLYVTRRRRHTLRAR